MKSKRMVLLLAGFTLWLAVFDTTKALAADDARALLSQANQVMGLSKLTGKAVHYRAAMSFEQQYQSDRTYPPFFSSMIEQEAWFEPSSGVLRVDSRTTFPGSSSSAVSTTVDDGQNAESIRGTQHTPVSRRLASGRYLSPFAVIHDWLTANNAVVIGEKVYRDYPRTVLQRDTHEGRQWLYLDSKSGFPVKLELTEPHYLWGERRIEYVWSNWFLAGSIVAPGSAFRIADGGIEMSQTVGSVEEITNDKAVPLDPISSPAKPPADLPLFLQPIAPNTTVVSPNVYLLSNPGYNEAVALINNEIWIFDATQGEERAREDSEAIAKLFPGKHNVNVVVTDLAWPHIAGVRFWVAEGATIYSHAAAREFLQRVVDRKWANPDALEKKRHASPNCVKLNFVPVVRHQDMANGQVRLIPIDGIGSEIALMAYLPEHKFLWASDYIQTLEQPSLYAEEVIGAAERAGITPERFAAQHLPLSEWSSVRAAQRTQR